MRAVSDAAQDQCRRALGWALSEGRGLCGQDLLAGASNWPRKVSSSLARWREKKQQAVLSETDLHDFHHMTKAATQPAAGKSSPASSASNRRSATIRTLSLAIRSCTQNPVLIRQYKVL